MDRGVRGAIQGWEEKRGVVASDTGGIDQRACAIDRTTVKQLGLGGWEGGERMASSAVVRCACARAGRLVFRGMKGDQGGPSEARGMGVGGAVGWPGRSSSHCHPSGVSPRARYVPRIENNVRRVLDQLPIKAGGKKRRLSRLFRASRPQKRERAQAQARILHTSGRPFRQPQPPRVGRPGVGA